MWVKHRKSCETTFSLITDYLKRTTQKCIMIESGLRSFKNRSAFPVLSAVPRANLCKLQTARTWNSFAKQNKKISRVNWFFFRLQFRFQFLTHFCGILTAPAPRCSGERWVSLTLMWLREKKKKDRRGRAATVRRSSDPLQQDDYTAGSGQISLVCSEPGQTAKTGLLSRCWGAGAKITAWAYNP